MKTTLLIQCNNPACATVTKYKNWADYNKKQPNSVPYCPECGKPCVNGVEEQAE